MTEQELLRRYADVAAMNLEARVVRALTFVSSSILSREPLNNATAPSTGPQDPSPSHFGPVSIMDCTP